MLEDLSNLINLIAVNLALSGLFHQLLWVRKSGPIPNVR